VLAFLPDPADAAPTGPPQRWQRVLLFSAAIAALATTQPWVRVQFERLFGAHAGPPGWQSPAGFTCLCSCLLVAILALVETPAAVTRNATRPASALLVALSTLAVLLHSWDGPGLLQGVTARWTAAFWLLAASLLVLLATCSARCGLLPARSQSSSGPPT